MPSRLSNIDSTDTNPDSFSDAVKHFNLPFRDKRRQTRFTRCILFAPEYDPQCHLADLHFQNLLPHIVIDNIVLMELRIVIGVIAKLSKISQGIASLSRL